MQQDKEIDGLAEIATDFNLPLDELQDFVESALFVDGSAPRPLSARDWDQLLNIQVACERLREQLNSVPDYASDGWRGQMKAGLAALDGVEEAIEETLMHLGAAGRGRPAALYTRVDFGAYAWVFWRRFRPGKSDRIYHDKFKPYAPMNEHTEFQHRLLAVAFGMSDSEARTLLRDHVQPELRENSSYLASAERKES